jgi:hypothetical protein
MNSDPISEEVICRINSEDRIVDNISHAGDFKVLLNKSVRGIRSVTLLKAHFPDTYHIITNGCDTFVASYNAGPLTPVVLTHGSYNPRTFCQMLISRFAATFAVAKTLFYSRINPNTGVLEFVSGGAVAVGLPFTFNMNDARTHEGIRRVMGFNNALYASGLVAGGGTGPEPIDAGGWSYDAAIYVAPTWVANYHHLAGPSAYLNDGNINVFYIACPTFYNVDQALWSNEIIGKYIMTEIPVKLENGSLQYDPNPAQLSTQTFPHTIYTDHIHVAVVAKAGQHYRTITFNGGEVRMTFRLEIEKSR